MQYMKSILGNSSPFREHLQPDRPGYEPMDIDHISPRRWQITRHGRAGNRGPKWQVNAINQQGNYYGRGQTYQYRQQDNEQNRKSSMNRRRYYPCNSPNLLQREWPTKTQLKQDENT